MSDRASSGVDGVVASLQVTCRVEGAELDCRAIWELEDIALRPPQAMRRARLVQTGCKVLHHTIERLRVCILAHHSPALQCSDKFQHYDFLVSPYLPLKTKIITSCPNAPHNAAQQVFKMTFFLLLIHHLATASKSEPIILSKILER